MTVFEYAYLDFTVEIELERDPNCGHWAWRSAEHDWSRCQETRDAALRDAREFFESALEYA